MISPKATRANALTGKELTEEEKSREYTVALIENVLESFEPKILKILDRYAVSEGSDTIDSKRHIEDILEEITSMSDVFLCYS